MMVTAHLQDARAVDCAEEEILMGSADWLVEGFEAFMVVKKCRALRLTLRTFR